MKRKCATAIHVMAEKMNQAIKEGVKYGVTTALTQDESGMVRVRTEVREVLHPPLLKDREKAWTVLAAEDYLPDGK